MSRPDAPRACRRPPYPRPHPPPRSQREGPQRERTALASALATETALGALLYTRIARHRALDQATRRRIHEAIAVQPGVRVGTLQAQLGLNYNTVLRHVRLLEKCGLVEGAGEGQRRYFVRQAAMGVEAKRAAIAAASPVAAEVLRYVQARGRVALPALRADLRLPRSSASTALARLEGAGLVAREPDGRRLVVVYAGGAPAGSSASVPVAPAAASPAPA